MQKCFIIMPITTPDNLLSQYGEDEDHFLHVLNHLFLPALESADLEAITPIAKGAELIHGGIIKNLETADLVLCDMSILNPNVFFELGIRTALNKPVSLVHDDVTKTIPFDTNIINNHTYKSSLNPWTLEDEIQALKSHIKASINTTPDKNSLWSYFSMSLRAEPSEENTGVESKVDFLNLQIEGLRRQLGDSKLEDSPKTEKQDIKLDFLIKTFENTLSPYGGIKNSFYGGREMDLTISKDVPKKIIKYMVQYAESQNVDLRVRFSGAISDSKK